MAAAARISEIGAGDVEELARFFGREAGSPADARHYEWFLLQNPAQPPDVPCGWIARDESGEVVGSKFCAAQRFLCAGQPQTLLMGGGFYVSSHQRGLGLALMRRYLEQGRRYALFASTMNEVSGALYEHYGGYPIPHTDHEWLGVLHWAPLLEEVLLRRLGRSRFARLVSGAGMLRPAAVRAEAPGRLTRIETSAELAGVSIDAPPEHARDITALRDVAFLRWRYFEGPSRSRALYVYGSEAGARALVAVKLQQRGARGQLRALTVLDYWGSLPASEIAGASRALAAAYRDEADVIVFRGQPPERQEALRACGFVRRALPRAVGVCIDRSGLLETRSWYMVPADGDMAH